MNSPEAMRTMLIVFEDFDSIMEGMEHYQRLELARRCLSARVAVVRPTRSEVEFELQGEFDWLHSEYANVIGHIVTAFIDRDWLAVSDSQETPTL